MNNIETAPPTPHGSIDTAKHGTAAFATSAVAMVMSTTPETEKTLKQPDGE
ncbi:Hypothetical protein SMAX5B_017667 [Scophthalmus maximus]|uniref:Uncharacterized protein n=1 Tax=Scophthalmus maximus TaxID=52904 RepID=A0A2U9C519_SCOMX|nr:Hypothetical protein SMAX5B_017667 [Scophthalmus maximus]